MRNAPPVVYPVGRFVWADRVWLVLAVLAVSGPVLLMDGYGGWRGWTLGSICLITLVLSLGWRRIEVLRAGQLSWDGQSWYLLDSGQTRDIAVQVLLCWDSGTGLLLKVSARHQRVARYVWLNRLDRPQQWHGLRCAVHADDTL